jgi:hypothetical protein
MILTLATNLAFALVAMVLGVFAEISLAIMGIARLILALVTSPYFINLPYTSGGIIDVGWPIVRDFANLGFALALLWIGLATALKISEYEAKKTLPRLILMILLVNFSPVICGLIVDAANIVMNFFLGAIGDWTPIWNFAKLIVADIFNIFTSKFFTEPVSLEAVARAAMMIVFCILTGFFFLLYAALFIVRYVAIWVLVILSPLAFFSYVFNKTGGYFKQWWNQFFQWAIIGIPASFFLYLSYQLLDKINTTTMPPPPPDFWGDFIGLSVIMNQIMVFMPILVLLLFGFLMSLSSGAMGATAIISTGKKWGSSTMKKGYGRAERAVMGSKFVGDRLETMAESKGKGLGGWMQRRVALEGKNIRARSLQQADAVKDPKIKSIIDTKDSTALAAYLKDPTIDPINKIKLLADAGENWDEDDMTKVRDIPDSKLEKWVNVASNRGMLPHVKKMVKDKPAFSRLRGVSDAFITDPTKEKNAADLKKIQGDFIEMQKRIKDGKATDYDKAVVGEIREALDGVDLANLDFSDIDKITKDHNSDAYYALAGQLNMERITGRLGKDSIAKLSPASLDSAVIQRIAQENWTPEKFNVIADTYGSERADKFISGGREGINTYNLMEKNRRWVRSRYYGNYTYLQDNFDAYLKGGTTPKGKIDTLEKYQDYEKYVDGGLSAVAPGWMSGGGTPPSSGIAIPPSPAPRKTPPPGGKFSGPPSGGGQKGDDYYPPAGGGQQGEKRNPNNPPPAPAPVGGIGSAADTKTPTAQAMPAQAPPTTNEVVFKGQTGYTYTQPIIDYQNHRSGAPGVIPGGKQIGNHPYQEFKHPLTGQQMIRRIDDRIKSKLEFYVGGKKVNLRMGQEIPINEYLVIKDRRKTINL